MSKDIKELLEERGEEYQIPFVVNASTLGAIIKNIVYNYPDIKNSALGGIIYMQIKLLRFAGNPEHEDTKTDLVGYATLIREQL